MTEKLIRKDENTIEVPIGYKAGMRVPGLIYLNAQLEKFLEPQAVAQVANVSTLPGIVGYSLAMPDIHTGYGFPIGGVAAFDLNEGIISPGGVGYDINCGVRLLRSNLTKQEVLPHIKDLVAAIYANVPSGVGSKGKIKLTPDEQKNVVLKGALWALEQGMGSDSDLEKTESEGMMTGVDETSISEKAYERGRNQMGTLGSGNHFIEIQYVSEIFNEKAAQAFGLFEGQVTVMIHTGSRGLGHQVCTDFLPIMERASKKYGIELYDRELACAPFHSQEAERYFSAMKGAANYAWANRQSIMHLVSESFIAALRGSPSSIGLSLVYDVAHNIAKEETHRVGKRDVRLIVHRKGATRAFPAGHPELPDIYRAVGQPVLIPGDMGRASFILIGTQDAMAETYGSTCHGAGRLLSRHGAIKAAKGRQIWKELLDAGVTVTSAGRGTLAEEMPEAYKNINNVISVVDSARISQKVAMLKPIGVVKG
ncbi:MAG: RtcB family protein [Nitrospirae bacterium]|nr:RtcB family protein [Nitrospirota bacterium]